MLNTWISDVQTKQVEEAIVTKSLRISKVKVQKSMDELEILQKVREIFQQAANETQRFLSDHISAIVTSALASVFPDKNLLFVIKFVKRRNSTECDLFLSENGVEFSLFYSKGYGITDIVSFAIHVAYIVLHQNGNVLFIDEPFRNLHKSRHGLASEMVRTISEELNMQFIIATHIDALKDFAHNAYEVTLKDGISSISLDS